jgi:hypothetical protein
MPVSKVVITSVNDATLEITQGQIGRSGEHAITIVSAAIGDGPSTQGVRTATFEFGELQPHTFRDGTMQRFPKSNSIRLTFAEPLPTEIDGQIAS